MLSEEEEGGGGGGGGGVGNLRERRLLCSSTFGSVQGQEVVKLLFRLRTDSAGLLEDKT